ncbi:MAG: hypothetical protein ACJZ70_01030 [Limisphaerales bacterium]
MSAKLAHKKLKRCAQVTHIVFVVAAKSDRREAHDHVADQFVGVFLLLASVAVSEDAGQGLTRSIS